MKEYKGFNWYIENPISIGTRIFKSVCARVLRCTRVFVYAIDALSQGIGVVLLQIWLGLVRALMAVHRMTHAGDVPCMRETDCGAQGNLSGYASTSGQVVCLGQGLHKSRACDGHIYTLHSRSRRPAQPSRTYLNAGAHGFENPASIGNWNFANADRALSQPISVLMAAVESPVTGRFGLLWQRFTQSHPARDGPGREGILHD